MFPTELASPHPALDFGPFANRLLWRAFEVVKRPFERRIEARLAALGGMRPRVDLMGARGASLTLLAHSPEIGAVPAELLGGCVVTAESIGKRKDGRWVANLLEFF